MQNMSNNLISIEIQQVPNNDNGHIGIVTTRVCSAQGCIAAYGIASALDANSNEPKTILDTASHDSMLRIQGISTNAYDINALPQASVNQALEGAKAKQYRHSSTKPASEKQCALLQSLGSNIQGFESIIYQRFNKPIGSLSSKEANDLIQELKSQQR